MRSRARKSQRTSPAPQLDLFACAAAPGLALPPAPGQQANPDVVPVHTEAGSRTLAPLSPDERPQPGLVTGFVRPSDAANVRVICLDDMPAYSRLDCEIVDSSLEALPPDKIWFTYAAVQACFGVSRATVARRMKEGLIPGIRFHGSNVLEDGPVRRFSRMQIRWLLLATRTVRSEHAEGAKRNFRLQPRT